MNDEIYKCLPTVLLLSQYSISSVDSPMGVDSCVMEIPVVTGQGVDREEVLESGRPNVGRTWSRRLLPTTVGLYSSGPTQGRDGEWSSGPVRWKGKTQSKE